VTDAKRRGLVLKILWRAPLVFDGFALRHCGNSAFRLVQVDGERSVISKDRMASAALDTKHAGIVVFLL